MRLGGKVALVTGAAGGIGAATVKEQIVARVPVGRVGEMSVGV